MVVEWWNGGRVVVRLVVVRLVVEYQQYSGSVNSAGSANSAGAC